MDEPNRIPEPCALLRDRLIDLLVASDMLHMSECELPTLPASRQRETLRQMRDERLALQSTIKAAREAVPGVARHIDPLLALRPGEWTTTLNQNLANVDALLLGRGRRAAGAGEAWEAPLQAIAAAKNLLINADYSAIADGPRPQLDVGERLDRPTAMPVSQLNDAPAKALEQYNRAIGDKPELESASDEDVYKYYREHIHDPHEDGILRPFAAWGRALRRARNAIGQPKNQPRTGRADMAGSVVSVKDI